MSENQVFGDPLSNKGSAFTRQERQRLGIDGFLPYDISTLDEQLARVRGKFDAANSDLGKHILLRAQQDSNETLFYAFVKRNFEEVMPIIYTPTVGLACQRFSQIYSHPRGLFLAYPDRDRLDVVFKAIRQPVRAVVVTDGKRVLGLGDLGIGGIGISIGKFPLYSAAAGLHPVTTLPIVLDVGTNNHELLNDPLYMGWRHSRIDGREYDEFVDEFVAALTGRFPNVLLQWDDFAMRHATPLLTRYEDQVLSFNDDIQGSAAVTLAAIRGAVRVVGGSLATQRIVFAGAGSAGMGIARMLSDALGGSGAQALATRILLVDEHGSIHRDRNDLSDYQQEFACAGSTFEKWNCAVTPILMDVVEQFAPTILVGVSGQPGLFTQELIRAMHRRAEQPIIFPLSNPTERAEAAPADLLAWTNGSAIIATGSPFAPVKWQSKTREVAQANNVYIFPGLALGALAARATKINDDMLHAAANAVVAATPRGRILPPLAPIVAVSRDVALAVARAAADSNLARIGDDESLSAVIDDLRWQPNYEHR